MDIFRRQKAEFYSACEAKPLHWSQGFLSLALPVITKLCPDSIWQNIYKILPMLQHFVPSLPLLSTPISSILAHNAFNSCEELKGNLIKSCSVLWPACCHPSLAGSPSLVSPCSQSGRWNAHNEWRGLSEEQIHDDPLKRCLKFVFKLQRNSHLVLKIHKRLFTESRDS